MSKGLDVIFLRSVWEVNKKTADIITTYPVQIGKRMLRKTSLESE